MQQYYEDLDKAYSSGYLAGRLEGKTVHEMRAEIAKHVGE